MRKFEYKQPLNPKAMKTNKNQHPDKKDVNATKHTHQHEEEDKQYVSPDKYLAMEQKGVTYTKDHNPVQNSDQMEIDSDESRSDKWKAHSANSRNADAFNQDDYILNDNIDLDEDQSQSISSEDDIDSNTLDETR